MKVDVIQKADATLPQHHPESALAGVRLLTTSSYAFLVLVAGAALSFGVQLGTVRLIGAESFGIFAYVIAWVTMLAYISTLGLSTSLLRLLPTYRVQGDWARAHGVMRFAFRGGTLAGIAVAALGIGAERFLLHAQGELARALLIGAIVVPLMTLRLIGASALRAFGAIIVSMLPERILRDSVGFLILAALVLGGLAPPDAVTAMASTLATAFITVLFIQRFLIGRKPRELVSAAPCYAIRDWLRPAVSLTLIMLADTIMSRAGILIIGLRNDTLGAGIFAVAFNLAQLVALPRMALSALFAPTVSALYARGDMVALQRLMARSAALSLASTLVVALPLIAGAPILLPWFGPQFVTAGPVLIVLVLGQLAAAAAGPQQHLFTMTGHERQGATLMATAAAATILGAALLVIPFGMMGVAVATTLSMIGWNIGMAIFLSRRFKLRPGLACGGNLSLKAVAVTFSRLGKAVLKMRGQS
ncbi:MATE family efflux transporter [Cypionkella psychrotolerans]|uniref:oligosaccharide flippase family protein n=1 Tax=Cypionkella psychrotolerans TaxID=1678131 RepID=UPI0006B44F48|nr:oligosaccharide flippase family protein [Cypionkella psychrotolerans]